MNYKYLSFLKKLLIKNIFDRELNLMYFSSIISNNIKIETFINRCNCKITTMKSKITTSLILSILVISLVSAIIGLSITTQPSTLTKVGDSTSFTVSAGTDLVNFDTPSTPITITDENSNKATLSVLKLGELSTVTLASFNVSVLSIDDGFSFAQKSTNIPIKATSSLDSIDTKTINVPINLQRSFCSNGKVGDLNIDIKVNNNGRGKDDEWYLLDNLEIEVEVENDGNKDIDEVVVEWALINKNTGEIINDDEEDDFDIDEDDKETVTFEIELDPDDFESEDVGDDLMLLVKAFSDDLGENVQCVSGSETAELFGEDFMVIDIDSINIPEALQCDSSFDISTNLWNIGGDDQEDVTINAIVNEFNFNKEIQAGDIDSLDNKEISFSLDVPKNIREGNYGLKLEVYDEDGDLFEDEDDKEAIFTKTIKVQGNCLAGPITRPGEGGLIDIEASLESDAVSGEELVIKTTITNLADEEVSYQSLVINYDDWASLKSVEPRSFSLAARESKDVIITLMANEDISGNQEFAFQVVHNGIVTEQKINVPIEAEGRVPSGITGSAIAENIRENWLIWLIALINIVLVILIIIVAIRMANR